MNWINRLEDIFAIAKNEGPIDNQVTATIEI